MNDDFDEKVTIKQGTQEIDYGIILGNRNIVFMKAGLDGGCYGYENKYFKIARELNSRHGCSVISASNPLGYQNDFALEMTFIRKYAQKQMLTDYEVYYFGNSNGAALGLINAYKFPEIKKAVCINGPLTINPHQVIRGLKGFSEEEMYLVYGSKDPSYDMLNLYSELESEKIKFVKIQGVDHNFSECPDLFSELPGILLFGDELTCKNVKIRDI